MSERRVSPVCVYTIVHTDKLDEIHRNGGTGTLVEKTKWITARELLREAQDRGEAMPVVFASAEITEELIYHAMLDDVVIDEEQPGRGGGTTTFAITGLTPFPDPKPHKTSLIVKSKGEPLSAGHIRPYVICETPREIKLMEGTVK